jgi:hypothetical protein
MPTNPWVDIEPKGVLVIDIVLFVPAAVADSDVNRLRICRWLSVAVYFYSTVGSRRCQSSTLAPRDLEHPEESRGEHFSLTILDKIYGMVPIVSQSPHD